jgi:hypothetical protein
MKAADRMPPVMKAQRDGWGGLAAPPGPPEICGPGLAPALKPGWGGTPHAQVRRGGGMAAPCLTGAPPHGPARLYTTASANAAAARSP